MVKKEDIFKNVFFSLHLVTSKGHYGSCGIVQMQDVNSAHTQSTGQGQ